MKKIYTCPFCKKVLKSKYKILNHIEKQHDKFVSENVHVSDHSLSLFFFPPSLSLALQIEDPNDLEYVASADVQASDDDEEEEEEEGEEGEGKRGKMKRKLRSSTGNVNKTKMMCSFTTPKGFNYKELVSNM